MLPKVLAIILLDVMTLILEGDISIEDDIRLQIVIIARF